MAAKVLTLIPKRTYDFSKRALNAQFSLRVAERIDISRYTQGVVEVRIFDRDWTNTGGITFELFGDGYTAGDPTIPFQTSAPLITTSQITTSQPGITLRIGSGALRGEYAALVITGALGTPGTARVTVSVDVVLRAAA